MQCCQQSQPGNFFYTFEIIQCLTDRMNNYKSLPLDWIIIYGDRLNWDDTDRMRYGIVQYGVLAEGLKTSGQASRFEPAYANPVVVKSGL